VSLESTKLVLGKAANNYADYCETCRRKRNAIDHTFSKLATETEAACGDGICVAITYPQAYLIGNSHADHH
jgi:hypothetical protein